MGLLPALRERGLIGPSKFLISAGISLVVIWKSTAPVHHLLSGTLNQLALNAISIGLGLCTKLILDIVIDQMLGKHW